jgi:hypothetical protein
MNSDAIRDVEKLYDQTLEFLKNEGLGAGPHETGSKLTEYQNNLRTLSENYLLKDNLLLLLKDI